MRTALAHRRQLLNALLALLALWAGLALAREVRHLHWRHSGGHWLAEEPCLWRYGTPPTARLETFLDRVRPTVDGREVFFTSRFDMDEPAAAFSLRDRSALCASLWAAYLLPEANIRRPPPGRPPVGSLWLTYDRPLPAGVRPLVSTPDGTLGRVAP